MLFLFLSIFKETVLFYDLGQFRVKSWTEFQLSYVKRSLCAHPSQQAYALLSIMTQVLWLRLYIWRWRCSKRWRPYKVGLYVQSPTKLVETLYLKGPLCHFSAFKTRVNWSFPTLTPTNNVVPLKLLLLTNNKHRGPTLNRGKGEIQNVLFSDVPYLRTFS